MALTDLVCRNATCPSGKTRARLVDSGRLYLEISPLCSKRWSEKYAERWIERMEKDLFP